MRESVAIRGVGAFPAACRVGMMDWRFAVLRSGARQDRIIYAGPTVSVVERQIIGDGWDPADYQILRSMPMMIAFDARSA